MTLRALFVLLAVLNLGVAAWWLFHAGPAPVAQTEAPSGIARLQLLDEREGGRADARRTPPAGTRSPASALPPPASPSPTPAAAATTPANTPQTVAVPPAPARCLRLGPYADAAARDAAQAALRPAAARLRGRDTREGGGRGWRVFLPAAADRAAADANAGRLRGAGFNDLLVVGDGAEANSVALGRFSTEARARQHAQAVRAAGFPAEAAPVGEARTSYWIDLALAAGADIAAVRRAGGGARSATLDCAGLR